MNSRSQLQTEESGIGNDIYYAASASPNANHELQRVPLFTVDRISKPVLNAAQRLEDQEFEDSHEQEQFVQCLTPIGTETYVFSKCKRRSIVIQPIIPLSLQQFDILRLLFKAKMMKALTMMLQMRMMNIHFFRTLQRPPSSQKNFLESFLSVQLSTGPLK
jgi:hypothetical protein